MTDLQSKMAAGELVSIKVEHDEPVLVNIGSRGPSSFNEKLGPLRIVDCYEEKYLLAHMISEGKSID